MAPFKPVHYSTHALDEKWTRSISREQVKWLISRGDRARVPSRGPTQYWMAKGYLGQQEAAVVFIEYPDRYLVVTVEWIEKASRTERRKARKRGKQRPRRPHD